MALDPSEVKAIDAQASVLMKRGIALMDSGRADVIPEALTCFDQARELRSGLPIREVPDLRYGLAACWLNRADALVRLGSRIRIAAWRCWCRTHREWPMR